MKKSFLKQLKIPKQLQSQTIRREMRNKYGNKAFLIAEELKFPIINPNTGELDVKLICDAYLKSKEYEMEQPSYKKISEKGKLLFIENNGPEIFEKMGIGIDESIDKSLVEDLLKLGLKRIISEKPLTDLKTNPTCVCPNCGFKCALGGYDNCSLQPCPVCDTFMISPDQIQEAESMEDKFGNLITETITVSKGKPGNKFICNNCNTIITYKTKEVFEIAICPVCKKENTLLLMFEDVNLDKKHNICPNCQSIFAYESTRTTDVCPICGQFFVTLGKAK